MKNKSVKILITDDDREDLELIEEAFLREEPTVQIQKFTHGKTALEFLNASVDQDLPCLVILDYSMPEINGSEMLLFMKQNDRYNHIPKIVLSTSNAPIHIHECLNNGATDYLVKPNSMKALQTLAKKLLAFCDPNQS
ncbi:response regulator [Longitalea arenae]|uniref:response regulator n=1 Tax=Longitalea arenae TaxID=2812558 RepID=UPI0019683160|nr:response regulator [Longitalea arenae]